MGNQKRQAPDWEAIEREYRADSLSVREIARRYGVDEKAIRRKAKAQDWKRDLSGQVRAAVNDRIVRTNVRAATHARPADKEIIAAAADRGASAVHGHLALSHRLAGIAARTMDALEAIQRGEDAPFKVVLGKGDCLATLTKSTSDVVERVANLERKALNLDGNQAQQIQVLLSDPRWLSLQQEIIAAVCPSCREKLIAILKGPQ